jgi:LuxR family maltose regulon positive regulatory protein
MAEPLLTTKLYIPPVSSRLVSRPHLVERLNDGLRSGHKLILVSAPAGFGKTTLVSDWVRQAELLTAWLSLDRGDDDPVRFWTYLIAALQGKHPDVGQKALRALQSPQPTPVEAVLTTLINDLAELPGPFVLVLDDLHTITAEAVHNALVFLIDHLPPQMHVIVVTRVDPPWPVARLRARRQMTELRSQDLRFACDEVATFVNSVMGLGLSDQDVTLLDARTEGWIAGLQMASLAMESLLSTQGRADVLAFIQTLSGSHRFILDYLVEEVLDRQPDEVQEFLLKTSVLGRLSAPLCDAVVGGSDSQATLNWLERANLFVVPLDGERHWYRYHRLFADLLQTRLQRTEPDVVPLLHQRASLWSERNGLQAEAIDHALAAGDLERAADLIERIAEATLMRGEVATFMRWVSALPAGQVRTRPMLCFYHAWTLLWQSRSLKAIESLLQDADEGDGLVAARVTAMRALLAGFRGQAARAAELSRRALEQLPEEEQFMRTLVTWILKSTQLAGESLDVQSLDDVLADSQKAGNVMLSFWVVCDWAELLMRQGRLHQAAATYRRALDIATDAQGERLPIAGAALVGLAELSREWGDLDRATQYLLEGIRLSEQWTEIGPLEAYICLARIRWAQGDAEGAREAIGQAQELAERYDLTDLDELTVAIFRAWLDVAQGDLVAVQRWAEGRDLFQYIGLPLREEAGDPYDHRMHKYELPVVARLLIAQGRSHEALALLEPLVLIAEWRGRRAILIESYALQALAWQAQGDLDRALSVLERALSLAEPEGYVRVLLDEGEPMRSLIAEFRSREVDRAYRVGVDRERPAESAMRLHAYADKLLAEWTPARISPPESSAPALRATTRYAVPIEPLTERELEVLRLLRTSLSLPEIADRLVLSANTVRSHAKHIYAKLDVHSRADALTRAQELGLL